MQEMLVILDDAGALASVEAVAQIHQRYGDRVLVVTTAAPERLRTLGTVRIYPAGSKVPEGRADLSETERMGIAAWNVRGDLANKQRPGDGLPWDSKGFKPP